MVYWARVEPIPGQAVPLLLPPFADEYAAECESMHLPTVFLGTAPGFAAAGAPAGTVLSTLASSADANKASPAGELPVPFAAKSTPPSITPARWPEPPKLNVTLLPPLAVWTKFCVMKSNAGSVFDAARKVVPVDWAEAGLAPTPTTPGRTATSRADAAASPGNENFLDNRVSPFL